MTRNLAQERLEALGGSCPAPSSWTIAKLRAAGLWVFVGLPPTKAVTPSDPPEPAAQTSGAPPSVPISRALRELIVAVRVTDPAANRSDDAIASEARDFLRKRGGMTAAGVRGLRDQALAAWKGAGSAHLTRETLIELIEDAASSRQSLALFNDLVAAATRSKVTRPGLAALCHVRDQDLFLSRAADRKRLAAARIDWKRYK